MFKILHANVIQLKKHHNHDGTGMHPHTSATARVPEKRKDVAGGKGDSHLTPKSQNIWILSITPKMWRAVEKRRAYATESKVTTLRICANDRVIFYVRGTGKFNCICRVASEWHEPSGRWPVRVTDEINLSVVKTGTAGVRGAASLLQFAKKSRWIGLHLHGGIGNYGRPIMPCDYDTISNMMHKSSRLLP